MRGTPSLAITVSRYSTIPALEEPWGHRWVGARGARRARSSCSSPSSVRYRGQRPGGRCGTSAGVAVPGVLPYGCRGRISKGARRQGLRQRLRPWPVEHEVRAGFRRQHHHPVGVTRLLPLVPGANARVCTTSSTTHRGMSRRSTGKPWPSGRRIPRLHPMRAGVLIIYETGRPQAWPRYRNAAQPVSGPPGPHRQWGGVGDQPVDGWAAVDAAGGVASTALRVACRWARRTPAFAPSRNWRGSRSRRPRALDIPDPNPGGGGSASMSRSRGGLWQAKIPYVMAIRPSHGTWAVVEGRRGEPPAFTPPPRPPSPPAPVAAHGATRQPWQGNWSATWRNWPCRPPMVPTSRVRLIAASEEPH